MRKYILLCDISLHRDHKRGVDHDDGKNKLKEMISEEIEV